jgi:hypothetical protein
MDATNINEQQRASKRITLTLDADLAEWLESEAAARRLGDSVYARMILAGAMAAAQTGSPA